MTEYLSNSQRDRLLDTTIISGDFILASGKRAKQKFDFDLVDSNSAIFSEIVLGLSDCIRDNFSGYNGILTVANGATRLGEPLSQVLGVTHINSSYVTDGSGIKQFSVEPDLGVDKVIIVDDVFTRGTNATKVAVAADELQIETLGVAVVLDRSDRSAQSILSHIAVASLIQKELN